MPGSLVLGSRRIARLTRSSGRFAGSTASTDNVLMEPYAKVHETHTGLVVLVDDLAYKGKKPIKTDFLDFRTPERRERACQRELELNRRLAPASYLGVAHLSMPWNDAAEPVLVMRRQPDSSRLATMVRSGQPVIDALLAIAEVLARFHQSAVRGQPVDAQGELHAVQARWQANIAEMRDFAGTVVDPHRLETIENLVSGFLAGRAALLAQRIADRRIVDGHGDLLTDDIFCLPDGPEILDCLEFDDDLRYVDAIDDAAFLAMDLEFLGRKDLAGLFLDHYVRLADDPAPRSLKDFYIAYRAGVRAKVDCVRCSQGHPDAAADAARHLDIALEHLRAGAVRLALVGGGPGTGKTTLAQGLAERVGAVVISSDEVRRELQGSGAIDGTAGLLNSGLYSDENVAAVYDEVLRRACDHLANGRSVILDATWRDPHRRHQARQLAAQTHSATVELKCTTPVRTAVQRVGDRPAGSVSDATPEIASALADDTREWVEARGIQTSRPLTESVDVAEDVWRRAV
jgi:aminoglycoside phosphotransferase family enzyme/predicted kinase